MSPQRLIDLDVFAGEPVAVKLAGRTWLLPADIPVPLFLRIQQFAELAGREEPDETQMTSMVESLYSDVLKLFQVHQPDVTELPIGMTMCVELVGRVYNPDDDDEPDPTPAEGSEPKTPSTSQAKKKTSRS